MRAMHAGDLVIDEDGEWRGMVGGDLTVAAGRRVVVRGMVRGDLIVEAEAEVRVAGMIGGRVINRGGRIEGGGMIAG